MAVPVLPSSAAPGREPVIAGMIPALADGFLARTETAPSLPPAVEPGAVVVLVPEGPGRARTRQPSADPAATAAAAAAAAAAGRAGAGIKADWAGVTGKTQIAVAYADWLRRSGAATIWVDAWSRASILAGYASAAATVGLGAGEGADTAARRLLGWLAQQRQPWLLVLDGLRDPADAQGLIPSGPAGMTLITTAADPRLIPESWRATTVTLGPLSPREAMSYLHGRLKSDLDQRAGMIDLVTEIGGDPSALAQACGVVQAARMSCRQYAHELVVRREEIAQAAGGAVPPMAAVTSALAVELAYRIDVSAWPALIIAASLGGQPVPWAVFRSATVARFVTGARSPDASAVAQALGLLASLALVGVDREQDGPAVRVSQPVIVAVRAGLARDDYDRALTAAAAGVTEAWPDDEPSTRLGSMLASCAVELWRSTGNQLWSDRSCPPMLQRTGAFLISAGMLSAAQPFWSDLSAAAERLLDPNHPDRLMIASRFASLLMANDEPVKPAERDEWIFGQLSESPPNGHGASIAAQLDLGRSLAAAGQLGKAFEVLELAAADSEQAAGSDHMETIAAAEDLAAACLQANDRDRAITLYQRALADRIRLQGARHPEAITARHRLARAYLATGDAKAAVSECKKVVADRQRELGKDHADTVAALGDLGTALLTARRFNQAAETLEQASAGYEQILGPDHRDTLALRVDLARAYDAIGWIVDAAVLLQDTTERCELLLPPGDRLTAAARELLDRLPQH